MNQIPWKNLVLRAATRSNHKQYRHVALVERGGALISVAYNIDRHHAEQRALARIRPSEREGARIWSFRLTKSGFLSMAKPCSKCMAAIVASGLKSVYYSDNNGTIQKIKIK